MHFSIKSVVEASTAQGKRYKKAIVQGEDGNEINVSVWSDFSQYAQVVPGGSVPGVIREKGQYKNLVDGNLGVRPKSIPFKSSYSGQNKQASIDKAMDRKEESIAFFNATNASISLVTQMPVFKDLGGDNLKMEIVEWRDFFFKEWENHNTDDPLSRIPF